MRTFDVEKMRVEIEAAYSKFPWLENHIPKGFLIGIVIDSEPKESAFDRHIDDFLHLETLWLFDGDGARAGEVGLWADEKGALCSFPESIRQALERLYKQGVSVRYILRHINFSTAYLWHAPDFGDLYEYCLSLRPSRAK